MHLALRPQVPGHGSEHFWDIQAKFGLHSALTTHSGRQLGGVPMKFALQEHTVFGVGYWVIWQILFGPQGEGSQVISGIIAITKYNQYLIFNYL